MGGESRYPRGPAHSATVYDEPFYCEVEADPSDVLYSGSEDEYYASTAARERRYEEKAELFLRGRVPLLLSTTLRGPFTEASGWKNPWKGRGGRIVKSMQAEEPRSVKRLFAVPAMLIDESDASHCLPLATHPEEDIETSLPSRTTLAPNLATAATPVDDETITRVAAWVEDVHAQTTSKSSLCASEPENPSGAQPKKRPAGSDWLRAKPTKRSKNGSSELPSMESPSQAALDRRPPQPLPESDSPPPSSPCAAGSATSKSPFTPAPAPSLESPLPPSLAATRLPTHPGIEETPVTNDLPQASHRQGTGVAKPHSASRASLLAKRNRRLPLSHPQPRLLRSLSDKGSVWRSTKPTAPAGSCPAGVGKTGVVAFRSARAVEPVRKELEHAPQSRSPRGRGSTTKTPEPEGLDDSILASQQDESFHYRTKVRARGMEDPTRDNAQVITQQQAADVETRTEGASVDEPASKPSSGPSVVADSGIIRSQNIKFDGKGPDGGAREIKLDIGVCERDLDILGLGRSALEPCATTQPTSHSPPNQDVPARLDEQKTPPDAVPTPSTDQSVHEHQGAVPAEDEILPTACDRPTKPQEGPGPLSVTGAEVNTSLSDGLTQQDYLRNLAQVAVASLLSTGPPLCQMRVPVSEQGPLAAPCSAGDGSQPLLTRINPEVIDVSAQGERDLPEAPRTSSPTSRKAENAPLASPAPPQSPWAAADEAAFLPEPIQLTSPCSPSTRRAGQHGGSPWQEPAMPSTPLGEWSSLPTPDFTLSIKSFRQFNSPSPEPPVRSRDRGILKSAPSRANENAKLKRRVHFNIPATDASHLENSSQAVDPDTQEDPIDAGLTKRASRSKRRPPPRVERRAASPPLPPALLASLPPEVEKFQDHFDVMTKRGSGDAGRRPFRPMLPSASQQLLSSPPVDAMAERFQAADAQAAPAPSVFSSPVEKRLPVIQPLEEDISAVLDNLDDFLEVHDVDAELSAARAAAVTPEQGRSELFVREARYSVGLEANPWS